jgi:proteasome lid subunit RPN8/RPN11
MLTIEQSVLRDMIAHAKGSSYEECGFLFGLHEPEQKVILKGLKVSNSSSSDRTTHFEISAKAYLQAERFAEEECMSLLGVYHSHPDHPAVPSVKDRENAQPYFSYVILSIWNKKFGGVRSWRLTENRAQFEEEAINLI